MADDWEWEDEDGHRWTPVSNEYQVTIWMYVPYVPVPYKRNKRRYGR